MQILNKRVLTQAVVASSFLLLTSGVYAVDQSPVGDVVGKATLSGATADVLTISGANSQFNAGAEAVLVTPGAGTVTITVNSTTSAKGAGISSDTNAILINNAGAGTALVTNITLGAGGIVQGTGAGNTIADLTAAGRTSAVTIANNGGTIRNTGTGSAIVLNGAGVTLTTLSNTGTISAVGAGAFAIDLNTVAAITNPLANSGTIRSTLGSAIRNTTTDMVINNTAGTITGKSDVVNLAGRNSAVNLSGGSIVATDGAAANAILTQGQVTITGGSVTGVINSTLAAAGSINFNMGGTNAFTTNGNLSAGGAGGTVVATSGILNLRNNVVAGGLTVAANGTVNVNANQTVAGALNMVAVGSKGVFDLTNSAAPVNAFGQIKAGAASDISGANLTVTNNGNGYIANGTVFKIIDAGAFALTKGAAVVNVPNGTGTAATTGSVGVYTYTAAINPSDVSVTVARRGLNTFGNNGLTAGVGSALESIGQASILAGAVNDANMMLLLGELGRLPTADAVSDALRQLVPPTNQMTMQSVVHASHLAMGAISDRLSVARGDVSDSEGYAAGESASGQSVWGQVFGDRADQRRRQGIFGYRADTLGVSLGTDMMVSDMVRLGVAATYSSTKSKTKSTPRNDNNTKAYQFALYGSYDLGCGWWDAMVAYANLRHTGVRRVAFGAIGATANNNHRGSEWAARVGYGYPFTSDNGWDVIPSAYVAWNRVDERAYTETNGGALNLRVNSHNVNNVTLGADVKFAYPMDVETGKFVPDFHLGLNYAVVQDREVLTAAFVVAGPSFRVNGMQPARFGGNAGVGLNLMTKNDVSFGVNYDANFKKDFFSHAGFLTVRYAL